MSSLQPDLCVLNSHEISALDRVSWKSQEFLDNPLASVVHTLLACLDHEESETVHQEIENNLVNWEDFSISDQETLTRSLYSCLLGADAFPLVKRGSEPIVCAVMKTVTGCNCDLEPESVRLFKIVALNLLHFLASSSVISKSNLFSVDSTHFLLRYMESVVTETVDTEVLNAYAKTFVLSSQVAISPADCLLVIRMASENTSKAFWLGLLNELTAVDHKTPSTLATSVGKAVFTDVHFEQPDLGYSIQCWLRVSQGFSLDSTGFQKRLVTLGDETSSISLWIRGDKFYIKATYASGNSEGVTFEGLNIERDVFYHVVIRQSSRKDSKVTLFVDGEPIQTVDLQFPFSESHSKSDPQKGLLLQVSFGGDSKESDTVLEIVNMFILNELVSPEWCLLSFCLGMMYTGNYQDKNITKYVTYKSLRQLEIGLQELYTGRSGGWLSSLKKKRPKELGELQRALGEDGLFNIDARFIALNFHTLLLDKSGNDLNVFSGMYLCKNSRLVSLKQPSNLTIPKITMSEGVMFVSREPLFPVIYALGGSIVFLKIIESCSTADLLETAVEILARFLENDWASLKEFETKSGYDILSTILKTKKHLITLRLLDVILSFVGYDHNSPIDSLLINPQAYGSLIADFEIWRPKNVADSVSRDIFKFLLFQFTVFGQTSKYSTYNLRLMVKMRIIKRFIQALKYGSFTEDILPVVHDSLLVLVKVNPTPEVLRSLSLYVVFASNKESNHKNAELQRKCGLCALDVLVSVACDPASATMPVNIKQFYKELSRSVTVRWTLLLLFDRDPLVMKLAIRLLTHLFINSTPKLYPKFIAQGGVDIISMFTMNAWSDDGVVALIFAGVFGVFQINDKDLHLSSLVDSKFLKNTKASCFLPEFLLVINNMVKQSVESVSVANISEDSKVFLDFISFQNAYLTSLTETFSNVESFRVYLAASPIFLQDTFDICLRFNVLEQEFPNDEIKGCSRRWRSFTIDLFMYELLSGTSMKKFFTSDSYYGTVFTFVIFPEFVNDLQAFFVFVENSINKSTEPFENIFHVLQTVLNVISNPNVDVTDCIPIADIFCDVAEKFEKHDRLTQKSMIQLASLKSRLGEYVVEKFSNGQSEVLKALLQSLILHQGLYMDKDTMNNERLAGLLSCIVPVSDSSELEYLAINFARMCYLHRQSDFPSIYGLISDNPESQEQLQAFFVGLLEMSDEEVTSGELFGTTKELFRSYAASSRLKTSVESLQQPINELLRELFQTKDLIQHKTITANFEKEMSSWIKTIVKSEAVKYNRRIQDQTDDLTFFVSAYELINAEACRLLQKERKIKWRVDQTELVDRMRLRLIPYTYLDSTQKPVSERVSQGFSDGVPLNGVSDLSVEDTAEVESFHEDSEDLEMSQDDKKRKILRNLYVGDRILELWNVSEILGLQAVESILIMGISHLYLIENYFHCKDGEIVRIDEAPANSRDPYMDLIAGGGNSSINSNPKTHSTKSWEIFKLVSISKRQFLLRDVALELFFVDGTSFLITCKQKNLRDAIYSLLSSSVTAKHSDEDLAQAFSLSASSLAPSPSSSIANRFANVFSSPNLSSLAITKKWRHGKVSNFYYLMIINTLAGRTFNDLTQYPIFPWVIADYTSLELDFSDPKTFRDLSKPMGAQTEDRINVFKERYSALKGLEDPGAPPFHYGTHYSSAMIVTSFLIRLEPFVQSYLVLQGGKFDHAERLFYSISKAWDSCSKEIATDVRELIPEFFFLPEFLVNSNGFAFGKLQNGKQIGDVELPPWAHGDPKIFIQKNREALESPYVSENLHKWIDLVFGIKQRGKPAIEALNVFHHLSYPGAINLDKIADEQERRAMAGIIHNFGQTPMQLFTKPHAARDDTSVCQLNIGTILDIPISMNDSHLKHPVDHIELDEQTGDWKGRSKLFSRIENITLKGIQGSPSMAVNGVLYDHMHNSAVSSIAFVSTTCFLTGCVDGTIHVWSQSFKSSRVSTVTNARKEIFSANVTRNTGLELVCVMRGHMAAVLELKTAPALKTCVSLDADGRVLVWDTLRSSLLQEIKQEKVKHVAIANDTGIICLVSGKEDMSWISLYTINGDLLMSEAVRGEDQDYIHCIDFAQSNWFIPNHGSSVYHEYWEPRCVLVTGWRSTVNVYKARFDGEGTSLALMRKFRLQLSDGDVTAVRMHLSLEVDGNGAKSGRAEVICGDSKGRLVLWH
ncbi:unnamed protein product [Kuraishia capsulata CBS 1993]|uniref:Beige protein homolog 1 n=1 Tax=Kuraishia capsulata CBS 1993 TaxID=1382522 RepID=W6MHH8_9ASCO|nr:uncharacterized protein KUCA_T00001110001 [Kuraishia capsulata CBS 1993]CDK25143.1 unnamed protein product [Kuraishia capsulata CBS 1993]